MTPGRRDSQVAILHAWFDLNPNSKIIVNSSTAKLQPVWESRSKPANVREREFDWARFDCQDSPNDGAAGRNGREGIADHEALEE
jgi:hypothetical protein